MPISDKRLEEIRQFRGPRGTIISSTIHDPIGYAEYVYGALDDLLDEVERLREENAELQEYLATYTDEGQATKLAKAREALHEIDTYVATHTGDPEPYREIAVFCKTTARQALKEISDE